MRDHGGPVPLDDDELRSLALRLDPELALVHADPIAYQAARPECKCEALCVCEQVDWCECLTPDRSRGPWFCATCFNPIEEDEADE